jgi:hypothetical protein
MGEDIEAGRVDAFNAEKALGLDAWIINAVVNRAQSAHLILDPPTIRLIRDNITQHVTEVVNPAVCRVFFERKPLAGHKRDIAERFCTILKPKDRLDVEIRTLVERFMPGIHRERIRKKCVGIRKTVIALMNAREAHEIMLRAAPHHNQKFLPRSAPTTGALLGR